MRIIKSPLFWLTCFVLFNAVIVLASPLLPFIDLPNHLAEATIYKYYGQTDNLFSTYYRLTPWYFPNTFYLIFTSAFPSVEFGDRIYFILYVLLLHGSIFLIIKELGGNLWYGLLSFLLTFNYNVSYGFSGFYMAIATSFLLFYILLLDSRDAKLIYKLVSSFLLVLLFFMHAQVALLGLLLMGFMGLYTFRKKPVQLVIPLLVSLPVIFLIIVWWSSRGSEAEGSTLDFLISYYKSGYLSQFYRRAVIVVMDHYQLYEGVWGVIVGLLFFLLIIVPVLLFTKWNRINRFILNKESGFVYPSILMFTAVGCYLFLPYGLPGQIPLYHRFSTIVILSCIVLGSVLLNKVEVKWFKLYVIGAVVAYSFIWGEYIYSFNRENYMFNRNFFSDIDNKSRMSALIYDLEYRGKEIYTHFPNYFIVWNKGISTTKIIDFRFGVIRRNISTNELPEYLTYVEEVCEETHKYKNLEYILVKGEAPNDYAPILKGFSLWKDTSLWKLYKNDMYDSEINLSRAVR